MTIAFDAMLLGSRRTGVENSILNLMRALSDRGSRSYRAYVPRGFGGGLAGTPCFELARVGGVSRSRIVRIAWEQLVLPRLARSRRYELIHAPGYLAPLFAPVPVVLTVYDVMALTHPELCRVMNRWNYRALLPASVRRAAAVIVPSDFTARELARTVRAAGSKIHVIPLAVSGALFEVPSEAATAATRRRLRLPERFVLSVGREEPKKNVHTLLQAFKGLRAGGRMSHGLVLAGPAGPSSGTIAREIVSQGLSEDVVRCGSVSDDDLLSLYHLADAFIFPSRYEGFGLPPLEAMACGTPVVCSTAGALPEVVGDAALTTPVDDADALGDAICTVLENDELRVGLIARGRERARRSSWETVASRTEAVYDRVLSAYTGSAGC